MVVNGVSIRAKASRFLKSIKDGGTYPYNDYETTESFEHIIQFITNCNMLFLRGIEFNRRKSSKILKKRCFHQGRFHILIYIVQP